MSVPQRISKGLLSAYRAAHYVVLSIPHVHIRVDAKSIPAAGLITRYRANSAALMTAWNPFSRHLSSEENERRNLELLACVEDNQFSHLPAEGRDPKGVWFAEASFLIFGLPSGIQDEWLVRFEQFAAVRIEKSGMAHLVLHPGYRQ